MFTAKSLLGSLRDLRDLVDQTAAPNRGKKAASNAGAPPDEAEFIAVVEEFRENLGDMLEDVKTGLAAVRRVHRPREVKFAGRSRRCYTVAGGDPAFGKNKSNW
jgi:hypothetical protein